MSENLHNIDKLFKHTIEKHEEEPSLNVWNAIDNNLDKKKVVSISKKYYKLKWASVALLLFSLGIAMYTLQIRKKNKELVNKNDIEKPVKINNETIKNNVNDFNQVPCSNDAGMKKTEVLKENKILQDTANENKYITGNADEKNNKIVSDQTPRQIPAKENPVTKTDKIISNIGSEDKKKNIVETIIKNKDITALNKEPIKGSNNVPVKMEKYFGSIPLVFQLPEILHRELNTIMSFNLPSAIPNGIVAIENTKSFKEKNKRQKNSSLKNSGKSLFSATLFFSPDIIGYNIKSDHPRFRDDDKDEIKKNEDPKSSSTFGILVGYNIHKNWELQSGATIFTRGTNINSKTIYARPDNNGNVNFRLSCFSGSSFIPLKSGNHPIEGDSTNASAKNSLQYIGIPLVLQYNISKGKLSIKPGVGIAVNFLLKNKIETVINTTSGKESASTNVQGLKTSYFNGSISIGAKYNLSKKIGLSFAPTARFALSPINKGEPVKTTLNSVGFATGLTFRF